MSEYPAWLIDTAFVAGGLTLPLSALAWFLRREVKRFRADVITEVKAATKQIQPGYRNEGGSLLDIAESVGRLDAKLDAHAKNPAAHR